MKTKEIEVWVDDNYFPWFKDGASMPIHPQKPTGGPSFKATLVIEIPEKKIEISESEFEEVLRYAEKDHANYTNRIRQKLFGTQRDDCEHQWEYLAQSIYKQCSQCEKKELK